MRTSKLFQTVKKLAGAVISRRGAKDEPNACQLQEVARTRADDMWKLIEDEVGQRPEGLRLFGHGNYER